MYSCGSDENTNETHDDGRDTLLRLSKISAGMAVDTTLSSIRFTAICVNARNFPGTVRLSSDSLTDVVNIYVDSSVAVGFVDSVINLYCEGKDVRLIGTNGGQELAIPFHTLHRFKAETDTMKTYEWENHMVYVDELGFSVNDWERSITNPDQYFRMFYGDAFHPHDSVCCFPQRESRRETIDGLISEGQTWDVTDLKSARDTALMLAAYNEFVNKLEVYDKVGSFCMFRLAMMDVQVIEKITWGRLMSFFSQHYRTQKALRDEAVRYMADKYANEGGTAMKELTEEDLRLLYPDRLRWNGRMSGVYEHRYDPYHLAEYIWIDPPTVITADPGNEVPYNR